MNIKSLSKLVDGRASKIRDSRRKQGVRRSLKARLMDTETTDDAAQVAIEALEEEEPQDVIEAVVQVLGETIDKLDAQVSDKKRFKPLNKGKFRKAVMDTESTEDAVSVATQALKDADPTEVVTAVVEILGGVIDKIQTQN